MPKVTRIPLVLRSEMYSRECGVERSVGCHVSSIIRHLSIAQKRSKSYSDSEFSEQDLERLATLGFVYERVMIEEDDRLGKIIPGPYTIPEHKEAWEELFSKHAREVEVGLPDDDLTRSTFRTYARNQAATMGLVFPGEMMWCDQCQEVFPGGDVGRRHCVSRGHKGLFFTPDGVMQPPKYRYGVKEWKYTGKSASRSGDDHMDGLWEWKVQTGFYCYMIDADYSELDAMFAHGDYTTRKPVMLPYRFKMEWSEAELHRNFTMLVSTARHLGWV